MRRKRTAFRPPPAPAGFSLFSAVRWLLPPDRCGSPIPTYSGTSKWGVDRRQPGRPSPRIYSWSVQGQPWTAHQWLWEALMYLMYSFAGIHGLWFLAFASAPTAGLLLRGALKERGVPEEKASAAGGIAPLMLVGWLKPWPQAGVYALFAAYLFLSLRRKWGARELLFTAALGLVWSNIHSTAVLFPLLLLAESLWRLFSKRQRSKKEALRSRLAAFVVAAAYPSKPTGSASGSMPSGKGC